MADFQDAIEEHKDLPVKKQVKAGQAIAGDMGKQHETFLKDILKMLDDNEIDPADHKSLLNEKIYDKLPQQEKDKIDLAIMNVAHLLEEIVEFRLSKETPDSSPHLQTMIEELWQMKERIESKGAAYDVFKF